MLHFGTTLSKMLALSMHACPCAGYYTYILYLVQISNCHTRSNGNEVAMRILQFIQTIAYNYLHSY